MDEDSDDYNKYYRIYVNDDYPWELTDSDSSEDVPDDFSKNYIEGEDDSYEQPISPIRIFSEQMLDNFLIYIINKALRGHEDLKSLRLEREAEKGELVGIIKDLFLYYDNRYGNLNIKERFDVFLKGIEKFTGVELYENNVHPMDIKNTNREVILYNFPENKKYKKYTYFLAENQKKDFGKAISYDRDKNFLLFWGILRGIANEIFIAHRRVLRAELVGVEPRHPSIPLNSEEEKKLKDLGYVVDDNCRVRPIPDAFEGNELPPYISIDAGENKIYFTPYPDAEMIHTIYSNIKYIPIGEFLEKFIEEGGTNIICDNLFSAQFVRGANNAFIVTADAIPLGNTLGSHEIPEILEKVSKNSEKARRFRKINRVIPLTNRKRGGMVENADTLFMTGEYILNKWNSYRNKDRLNTDKDRENFLTTVYSKLDEKIDSYRKDQRLKNLWRHHKMIKSKPYITRKMLLKIAEAERDPATAETMPRENEKNKCFIGKKKLEYLKYLYRHNYDKFKKIKKKNKIAIKLQKNSIDKYRARIAKNLQNESSNGMRI
ncbi:MAG: hypothetical protein LBP39_03820 [Rickettsiales bacterium]|jgi:hypothetical protein|nr:hypothetical protein [Rickettsiales bacterium]